jgi:putative tryptophan/tyrosine transport system substrate-binding protein
VNRRRFLRVLSVGMLAAPLAAEGQPAGKIPRVGYLLPVSDTQRNAPFWEGLRKLGWIEDQNIHIERRYTSGRRDQPRELVRLHVDVIVADGAAAVEAARQATTSVTIPIVMVAANPVELGLIASLARPGGHITGVSTNSPILMGKRFEILKETVPRVSRVAVLYNAGNPTSRSFLAEAVTAARVLGLSLVERPLRSPDDVAAAFAASVAKRAEALLLIEDPVLMSSQVAHISALAIAQRWPTIAGSDLYSGILLTYGPLYSTLFERTAFYVDRILNGARPADLPVEEPTTFELVINLKTAKALGLTIPPAMLARADKIIE